MASISTFVLANKTIYMTTTQQPACGLSMVYNMRGALLALLTSLYLNRADFHAVFTHTVIHSMCVPILPQFPLNNAARTLME